MLLFENLNHCQVGSFFAHQMNDFGSDGLKCRLEGMVIRDEFLCPIMYQLFREPVIAQDGHTYERSAIEKWFEKHSTSPRTGNTMVRDDNLYITSYYDYLDI